MEITIKDYHGEIKDLTCALENGIRPKDIIVNDGDLTIVFESKARPGAKQILSENQIAEIRQLYTQRKERKYTQKDLAELYGVARSTIAKIVSKK